jgi:UDP-N-acetylmuramate dehydrogenase
MKFHQNHPLKNLNTFAIDAKAKYFVSISDSKDLLEIIDNDIFRQNKHFILGGGSNVLFNSDFDGLVIHMDNLGIEIIDYHDEFVYIKANAGVVWDDFVGYCVENGFGGVENLSLIPGKVGASPVQNIGAYGTELKEIFYEAEIFNLKTKKSEIYNLKMCNFGYRDSIFKNELKNNAIVVNVILRLKTDPVLNLAYRELGNRMNVFKNPTIKDVRKTVIAIRSEKLPDPAITPNSGSFFKNPVIDKKIVDKILILHPELKTFPADEGKIKLAAGQLIELCGLKSNQEGKVAVHPNQALVIINKRNASGNEIVEFSKNVQKSVYDKFGVVIEPEVNII